MMLDLEKLYEPYSKDVSLEKTLEWLKNEAKDMKIDPDVMQAAIVEVFTEMAHGKKFSTVHEHFTVANAEMNLYLKSKMIELNQTAVKAFSDVIKGRVDAALLGHIQADNKAYTSENMAYSTTKEKILMAYYKFMNFKRSPVLNGIKRIKNGL